jgi:hypothetical protein
MHDTNSPTPIDPQLPVDPTRLTPQPLSLPTRGHDDIEGAAEDGDAERSDKRQKLNLWKCRQCRDARKKVRVLSASISLVCWGSKPLCLLRLAKLRLAMVICFVRSTRGKGFMPTRDL